MHMLLSTISMPFKDAEGKFLVVPRHELVSQTYQKTKPGSRLRSLMVSAYFELDSADALHQSAEKMPTEFIVELSTALLEEKHAGNRKGRAKEDHV